MIRYRNAYLKRFGTIAGYALDNYKELLSGEKDACYVIDEDIEEEE